MPRHAGTGHKNITLPPLVAPSYGSIVQIMLREHFRCVAPIIAFSSQFYQGGLVPLRIPKPSERLDAIEFARGHRREGRRLLPRRQRRRRASPSSTPPTASRSRPWGCRLPSTPRAAASRRSALSAPGWGDSFILHGGSVEGPFHRGDDRFAVILAMDAESRATGERSTAREVAVHTVDPAGRIARGVLLQHLTRPTPGRQAGCRTAERRARCPRRGWRGGMLRQARTKLRISRRHRRRHHLVDLIESGA